MFDSIDMNILKLLQKDARMSASDISRKVDLSISAVGERIRKLEKADIIKQYTTTLDSAFFEKELTAFMLISIESPNVSPRFYDFIEQEKEILSCFYIAGDYDYIIKIVTKNTSTLAEVLDRIKSLEGIIKTNTMVVLDTKKEQNTFYI
ncbi:Lrp/AsnC family transcriptional regulator [Anaerosacchariphilus polymeriproducens]|uniref:Lrp/AsnC family transcriptional regulator n=1 Tax=Anaerosacchariphilus polymeriproducens TaxID=1812858 RepID=A0A371AZS9_9FIRM|nr:Lrp/AsnC family transcriptional regulator [Anaerosacchariphilus polymeriproducens]RDU25108.1 Lrp/AsnC family transcriptional regulator [Anaerosacchariphilus polymeriproducens]